MTDSQDRELRTKKYVPLEDVEKMANDYFEVGQGYCNAVELTNWRYYRRRKPTERPEHLKLLLVSHKNHSPRLAIWADSIGSFICQDLLPVVEWKPSDVVWWAYAYIPEEEDEV